ncbi:flagellar hook-length control protein FliK [Methylobacterium sp. WSM2598]|uniref:flagellar hook-length control protein FliK n=1 Tax=Methylobacterium sp. WSM2598 TaxID=398261 RepID=UPI00039DF694|nr:flagellar hook-length control protein FliK [Methylobacterium sp. WSM2598]
MNALDSLHGLIRIAVDATSGRGSSDGDGRAPSGQDSFDTVLDALDERRDAPARGPAALIAPAPPKQERAAALLQRLSALAAGEGDGAASTEAPGPAPATAPERPDVANALTAALAQEAVAALAAQLGAFGASASVAAADQTAAPAVPAQPPALLAPGTGPAPVATVLPPATVLAQETHFNPVMPQLLAAGPEAGGDPVAALAALTQEAEPPPAGEAAPRLLRPDALAASGAAGGRAGVVAPRPSGPTGAASGPSRPQRADAPSTDPTWAAGGPARALATPSATATTGWPNRVQDSSAPARDAAAPATAPRPDAAGSAALLASAAPVPELPASRQAAGSSSSPQAALASAPAGDAGARPAASAPAASQPVAGPSARAGIAPRPLGPGGRAGRDSGATGEDRAVGDRAGDGFGGTDAPGPAKAGPVAPAAAEGGRQEARAPIRAHAGTPTVAAEPAAGMPASGFPAEAPRPGDAGDPGALALPVNAAGAAARPSSAPPPGAPPSGALPSATLPHLVASLDAQGGPSTAMAAGPLRILTLQLRPADLGSVTVTMRLRDGQLDMSLKTSRAETAEMLRKDADLLAGLLREAGYRPDSIGIQAADSRGSGPQGFASPAGSGGFGAPGGGQPSFAEGSDHPARRHQEAGADQRAGARGNTQDETGSQSNSGRSGVYL